MSEQRSAEALVYRRWYKTVAWTRIRMTRLRSDPLCVLCLMRGLTRAAAVVDHKQPHRGDRALFFDFDNTQSLCKPCHDGVKQREEARGFSAQLDEDGWPLDPAHPANRES